MNKIILIIHSIFYSVIGYAQYTLEDLDGFWTLQSVLRNEIKLEKYEMEFWVFDSNNEHKDEFLIKYNGKETAIFGPNNDSKNHFIIKPSGKRFYADTCVVQGTKLSCKKSNYVIHNITDNELAISKKENDDKLTYIFKRHKSSYLIGKWTAKINRKETVELELYGKERRFEFSWSRVKLGSKRDNVFGAQYESRTGDEGIWNLMNGEFVLFGVKHEEYNPKIIKINKNNIKMTQPLMITENNKTLILTREVINAENETSDWLLIRVENSTPYRANLFLGADLCCWIDANTYRTHGFNRVSMDIRVILDNGKGVQKFINSKGGYYFITL